MAHLLGAESIRMSVGSRLLLDDVTLGIADGDRVGVLGPNGAGKSTLLAALAGSREVDGGRVTHSGDTRVAMLVQSDDFGTRLHETLCDALTNALSCTGNENPFAHEPVVVRNPVLFLNVAHG